MDDVTKKVRERAYQLWIEEGRPSGKERDHWDQAARELGFDQTAEDDRLDQGLKESFPSSDPASEAQPGGGVTGPASEK